MLPGGRRVVGPGESKMLASFAARLRAVAVLLFLSLAFASAAHAQATRTWVSGTGDDVNPCSLTAPCKTYAGAISKTARGGIISTLDNGGFGAVTITKSITIEGTSTNASLLTSGGSSAILINITDPADTQKAVVLRNLQLIGGGASIAGNAIRVIAANSVSIDNVSVNEFATNGIDVVAPNVKVALRNFETHRVAGAAVHVLPSSGTAVVDITGSRFSGSGRGVYARTGATVVLNDTAITNATTAALNAEGTGVIFANRAMLSASGVGALTSSAASVIRLTDSTITASGVGVDATTGQVLSYGDNRIGGNTVDGEVTTELGTQ